MYRNLLDLIYCPACGQKFTLEVDDGRDDILSGELKCNCPSTSKIDNGVLILNQQEQKGMNEWEKMEQESKLEKIDKLVQEKTPPSQKQFLTDLKTKISEEIIKTKPEWLLDIATGRGMLMHYLLKNPDVVNSVQNFICTDLSPTILQYDKKKFENLSKNIKINYISCDAAKLPFLSEKVDMIVSLFGFANMSLVMPAALEASFNVLKANGVFLNTAIFIKENSIGFQKLQKLYAKYDSAGAEQYSLHDPNLLLHDKLGFSELFVDKITSGTGEENVLDLIPYENEYYEVALIKGVK